MIRLLVADDETLIRDALVSLLELEDDLEVVAVATSGQEAVAAALHQRPDVAKLGTSNRHEAIQRAQRQGWI